MNANNLSGQERIERRAAYEQFRMVVCRNGYVNIVNQSHNDDSNHTYSVEVTEDGAVSCSCPHYQQRGQTCKHMVAVTDRPLTLSSAQAAQSTYDGRMLADGGSTTTDDESRSEPTCDELTADPSNGGGPAKQQQTQTCDECDDVEHGPGGLIDVSDDDWNEYDRLCSVCLIEVGGPGDSSEDTDDSDTDSRGVVDVGRCRCGNTVTGDDVYCSERCRERGEIDTTPL